MEISILNLLKIELQGYCVFKDLTSVKDCLFSLGERGMFYNYCVKEMDMLTLIKNGVCY